jgi:hypothetical protein
LIQPKFVWRTLERRFFLVDFIYIPLFRAFSCRKLLPAGLFLYKIPATDDKLTPKMSLRAGKRTRLFQCDGENARRVKVGLPTRRSFLFPKTVRRSVKTQTQLFSYPLLPFHQKKEKKYAKKIF